MRERREEEKSLSSAPGKAGYESRGFKQSSPTPCLVGSITHSAQETQTVRVERAVALPILGSASLTTRQHEEETMGDSRQEQQPLQTSSSAGRVTRLGATGNIAQKCLEWKTL